jgi:excisionase family DNA binding protein
MCHSYRCLMGVRPLEDQPTPVQQRATVPADAEEGDVDTGDRLLTPGEVAALFRVDPKTVTRWAAAGRIGSIRTPGGHRRFRESEVRALLEGEGLMPPEETSASSPNGSHPNGNRSY